MKNKKLIFFLILFLRSSSGNQNNSSLFRENNKKVAWLLIFLWLLIVENPSCYSMPYQASMLYTKFIFSKYMHFLSKYSPCSLFRSPECCIFYPGGEVWGVYLGRYGQYPAFPVHSRQSTAIDSYCPPSGQDYRRQLYCYSHHPHYLYTFLPGKCILGHFFLVFCIQIRNI